MMAQALQIDTLAFSKKLREAGADEGLAEAIVEGISAADTSELVTKGDLDQAVIKLDAKIDTSVTALNDKIDTSVTALQKDVTVLNDKIDTSVKALEEKMATKAELAEVKAEIAGVRTEIAQASNKTIYTLGGVIGVLFVIDRFLPLLGTVG